MPSVLTYGRRGRQSGKAYPGGSLPPLRCNFSSCCLAESEAAVEIVCPGDAEPRSGRKGNVSFSDDLYAIQEVDTDAPIGSPLATPRSRARSALRGAGPASDSSPTEATSPASASTPGAVSKVAGTAAAAAAAAPPPQLPESGLNLPTLAASLTAGPGHSRKQATVAHGAEVIIQHEEEEDEQDDPPAADLSTSWSPSEDALPSGEGDAAHPSSAKAKGPKSRVRGLAPRWRYQKRQENEKPQRFPARDSQALRPKGSSLPDCLRFFACQRSEKLQNVR